MNEIDQKYEERKENDGELEILILDIVIDEV